MIRRLVCVFGLCLLAAACGRGEGQGDSAASMMMFHPAASAIPDTCDARSLTWLVGKPRTAIPVAADLDKRRVACTTCPGPTEARPDRTDILYDDKTDKITQVTCG